RLPGLPVAHHDGLDVNQCSAPAHGQALATASLQRLRGRRARRVAFLVAGEARHAGTAAVCGYSLRTARLPAVQAPARPRTRAPGGESPRRRRKAPDLRDLRPRERSSDQAAWLDICFCSSCLRAVSCLPRSISSSLENAWFAFLNISFSSSPIWCSTSSFSTLARPENFSLFGSVFFRSGKTSSSTARCSSRASKYIFAY